jgi:2-polyprenyl-3-methyl-5-hydroxy-6-metoxy-1,4-benzoquinol methylase
VIELNRAFFPDDPAFVLLDVGPGFGGIFQRLGTHTPVIAVEPDERIARDLARRMAPEQLLLCRAVGEVLPLRSGAFDGVTLLEVLEHVDDPDEVLAEVVRVLKPGGALCVAVPTSYTEAVYSRLHPRYMSNAAHVRIFKKQELIEQIRGHGFDVLDVRTENLEPAVSWLFHSLFRSRSDATGFIYEHHWIDGRLARIMERVSKTPGAWRVVPWARRHLGKSWYVYARKLERPHS